ncbi:MAG TPA: RagB/SusD family nutrient uptake outer membrane protein [Bacteroidetes bacterium]|nr:RagB/SusD family nutrient uptake outer membrane protein [Bacteroidota bacterium]
MKNIKIYLSILFIALVMPSCNKWIDPDINTDPDALSKPTVSILLPGIEAGMGYYIGGTDLAGTQAVWTQQLKGTDRQFKAIDNYVLRESDTDNLWSSLYDVMNDTKIMIDLVENATNKSPHVAGAGKVIMALLLGNLTDAFGDIPYTEALQGADNLTPAYDSQESIYNEIFSLLDAAISDLQAAENTVAIAPDYIYGGDASSWLKAAYTLKARYMMHLSAVSSVDYNAVISNLDNGLASIGDDMEQPFGTSSAENNPMFQFWQQRSGYIDSNLGFDTVYMNGDPRQSVLQFSGDGFWTQKDAPVAFVQYTEALFIKAEAQYRMGSEDNAKATLKEAIRSSLTKYGVMDGADSWLATMDSAIDSASGEGLLEMIMTEKYKHMYLQTEAFVDLRRTGYPKLTPTAGDKLPSHYPYPTSETSYNKDNVPDVSVFTKMWWMP